jgi:hypothetical protein
MGCGQEAYVGSTSPEEMILFLLPAIGTVCIIAGQLQSFCSCRPSRPCCHTQLQRVQLFGGEPASELTQKGVWGQMLESCQ